MDKRSMAIWLTLAAALCAPGLFAQSTGPKTVITVPRFYVDDSVADKGAGQRLRASALTILAGSARYKLRESADSDMERILEELGYQNSGLVSEESIKKLGRQLGADVLLLADLMASANAGMLTAYIRIIEVESALHVEAIKFDFPDKSDESFAHALRDWLAPRAAPREAAPEVKNYSVIKAFEPLPTEIAFTASPISISAVPEGTWIRWENLNAWAEAIQKANEAEQFDEALRVLGLLEAKLRYYDADSFYEADRHLYADLKAGLPAQRKTIEANKAAYEKAQAEAEAIRKKNEHDAAVYGSKLKLKEYFEAMFPKYRDAKEAQDAKKVESLLADFFTFAESLAHWSEALFADDLSEAFYTLYRFKPADRFGPGLLVYIPGGSFTRFGTSKAVTLSAYYIGRYEVTQAEYKALMGYNPSSFTNNELNPVEQVTWYDALAYCNARSAKEGLKAAYTLSKVEKSGNRITSAEVRIDWGANGYRLPTEAEWEYACRAGTSTAYYWGNEPSGEYANGSDYDGYWPEDGYDRTSPVGSYKANAWGLYDTSGNVWEWCWDAYEAYVDDGKADPKGPDADGSRKADYSSRVLRGGSWSHDASWLRSSVRCGNGPGDWDDDWGFRIVRPAR